MQKISRKKVLARRWRKSQNPHPQENPRVRRPAGHPHPFRFRICRARSRREFCTTVHRFAQRFMQNLIDGTNGKQYLTRQIEPGSFRTLRVNLEGATAVKLVAPSKLTRKVLKLPGSI